MTVDPELRWPKLLTSGKKSRNFGSQTRPCRRSCRSHGWSRHSRTLWGKKLRRGLTSVTQETTKQIAIVKSGLNSLLIFTKTNFLFVSCVAEVKPRRSFFPHKVLECHTKRYLQIRKFGGCIWGTNFFPFRDRYVEISVSTLRMAISICSSLQSICSLCPLTFMTCINKC